MQRIHILSIFTCAIVLLTVARFAFVGFDYWTEYMDRQNVWDEIYPEMQKFLDTREKIYNDNIWATQKKIGDCRTKIFTDHQDSIKRRITFYKDSFRNKEIADSITFAEYDKCEKKNDSTANCLSYSFRYDWRLTNFRENIEEYNYAPLNVWKIFQGDDYYFKMS